MTITYVRPIGRIAVDLYDFLSHIDGTDFRQKAHTVDLNAPLVNLGNATNVQTALEYIDGYGLGGSGASSEGAITTVQVSDGVGGFNAATGVTAGMTGGGGSHSFINIDAPADLGYGAIQLKLNTTDFNPKSAIWANGTALLGKCTTNTPPSSQGIPATDDAIILGTNGAPVKIWSGAGDYVDIETGALDINNSTSTMMLVDLAGIRCGVPIGGIEYENKAFGLFRASITQSSTSDTTLTAAQAACPVIRISGTPGGSFNVIAPVGALDSGPAFIVVNDTANQCTFKSSGGSGVAIPANAAGWVLGTNSGYIAGNIFTSGGTSENTAYIEFTFTADANQTLTADESNAGVLVIFDDSATTAPRLITSLHDPDATERLWIINLGTRKHSFAYQSGGTITIEPYTSGALGRRLVGGDGDTLRLIAYGDGADQITSAAQFCSEQGQLKAGANLLLAALGAGSGTDDEGIEHYGPQRHYQHDNFPERREEFCDANGYGLQFERYNSKNVTANSSATLFTINVPNVACAITITVTATVLDASGLEGYRAGELIYKCFFVNNIIDGLEAGTPKDLTDVDFRHPLTEVALDFSVISNTQIQVLALTNSGGSGPETNFIATCIVQLVKDTDLIG